MILLVAHDAGGAEILSSWALRQDRNNLKFALEGPAREIFKRKLGESLSWPVGRDPEFILCGSGTSGFERDYVKRACIRGIRSIVWLDHWKNYALRFDELPSEVWVTDSWAKSLFWKTFPEAKTKVVVQGNPYLEDLLADIKKLRYSRDGLEHVLYVHEPGREREFQRWVRHYYSRGQLLRERPHPLTGIAERTLAEDIAWADTVIGCDSMALAVAVKAGKRTVSVLPKNEPLHIPYRPIERLHPRVAMRSTSESSAPASQSS